MTYTSAFDVEWEVEYFSFLLEKDTTFISNRFEFIQRYLSTLV